MVGPAVNRDHNALYSAVERSVDRVRSYFGFAQYHTSFFTEAMAGTATYLSLSYIFIVNPTILAEAGINPNAALFATVVASTAATLLMGLWARLPFAVAPGLELNGYFALMLCGTLHLRWTQGLTVVLLSGMLNVVFTSVQLRDNIVTAIPSGLRRALSACIGAFVISIAFQLAGVIRYNNGFIDVSALTQDSLVSQSAMVMYIGAAAAFVLGPAVINFPLNILGSLLISFILCLIWKVGFAGHPFNYSRDMFAAVGSVDLSVFTLLVNFHTLVAVIVLFIIDFVGGAGKIVGLSAATNIEASDGNVPNLKRGLYVDGTGTILGALLGTSSLVAFVESGVGIKAGGRTGLTAVVCAAFMSISFLFAPLLHFVPPQAATGVLVFVGYLLTPLKIDPTGKLSHTVFDLCVGYLMAAVAFLTFGIDKAMALGFSVYFIRNLLTREFSQETCWLGGIALVLDVASVVPHLAS